MKSSGQITFDDITPEIREEVRIAVKTAMRNVKINAVRDPLAIDLGRKTALYRSAAELVALRFAYENNSAPTELVRMSITFGPIGSIADFNFDWATKIEERNMEIDFRSIPSFLYQQDTTNDLPSSRLRSSEEQQTLSLGICDYEIAPFDACNAYVWIQRISEEEWEITISVTKNEYEEDEDQDEKNDTNTDMTETVANYEEAVNYLHSLGISLADNQLQDIKNFITK